MANLPRSRLTNNSDPVSRPVLGPAGNKLQRKPTAKTLKKSEKLAQEEAKQLTDGGQITRLASPVSPTTTLPQCLPVPLSPSILRHNLSMSASCSSDASSSDSSPMSLVSSSSGRRVVHRGGASAMRRKQSEEKVVKGVNGGEACFNGKKRCAWVTSNSDPCYAAFHDEEWGVPIHDDKKLFELLCLSGALAELSWPAILNKRHLFREVFMAFDPVAVSKLSEKRILTPGGVASSLLSEVKLRSVIENARQMCKVIEEFGSFDKYIWNFVNQKPIVNQFRYPRQVPVKTPKADVISKDLVRRGFRGVGQTIIYTFMQVAGLTNDHLISCFRHQECVVATVKAKEKDDTNTKIPDEATNSA